MAGKLVPEKTYSRANACVIQYNGQFGPWVQTGFVSFDKEGGIVRKSSMSLKKFLSMDMEAYCRSLIELQHAMQEQVAIPDSQMSRSTPQSQPTRAVAQAPAQSLPLPLGQTGRTPVGDLSTGFESMPDAVNLTEPEDDIPWG